MRVARHTIVVAPLLVFVFCAKVSCEILTDDSQQSQRTANPESFENLAQRAQAAMDADRIPEALRLYDRATKLHPSWSEGWWHLGTLYFDAQHFEEARNAFAHFVSAEHKQPGPGFAMLGLSEFQLAHYSQALAALETGTRLGVGTDPAFVREVLLHD